MGEALEVQGQTAYLGEHACQLLTTDEVALYWPKMVLELRKIKHVWEMWWTEDAFWSQIMTGNMQVWAAGKPPDFNLVVMTQVLYYPASSIFQAVLMFGTKVDETLPVVVGTLEYYAQQRGCAYAEVFGRPGWKKKLGEHGYRESASVLSKPLGDLRRH